jgi:hypothetical protein
MISASEAEKAGIAYVDIWDGFVDEEGQFSSQGSRLNAPRSSRAQTGLMKVMGVVWVPGVASALASVLARSSGSVPSCLLRVAGRPGRPSQLSQPLSS